ncbi:anti-sigma regulatory factor [Caldimonas tepidiphila]|uniref:anti-sigma regulatory factor n=1 Tax=Caldimonas tepidiphila TaxID=2315841 RepID=UPI000E5B475D|nr:anti-sigma regulatory factor [Caldimonas tepidiphila]
MALHNAAPVTVPLNSQDDVVRLRQVVRDLALAQGLSLVDQTKLITAASELARNTVIYGGGGSAEVVAVREGLRSGVQLTLRDEGPGIADIELALKDGYTTGNGLGLGLSGARRLSDLFDIDSAPGRGTRVSITKWKR